MHVIGNTHKIRLVGYDHWQFKGVSAEKGTCLCGAHYLRGVYIEEPGTGSVALIGRCCAMNIASIKAGLVGYETLQMKVSIEKAERTILSICEKIDIDEDIIETRHRSVKGRLSALLAILDYVKREAREWVKEQVNPTPDPIVLRKKGAKLPRRERILQARWWEATGDRYLWFYMRNWDDLVLKYGVLPVWEKYRDSYNVLCERVFKAGWHNELEPMSKDLKKDWDSMVTGPKENWEKVLTCRQVSFKTFNSIITFYAPPVRL